MSFSSTVVTATFPFGNLYEMLSAKPSEVPINVKGGHAGGKLEPYPTELSVQTGVQLRSIPMIVLAVLCLHYTVDMNAASVAYDFSNSGWVFKIVYRDLFLFLLVPCTWDWLHYSSYSPIKKRLESYKLDARESPGSGQFCRDFIVTTSACLLASLHEVLLIRWWASGSFKRALFGTGPEDEASIPWGDDNPFFGSVYTPYFVLWTITMLHWRIAQFWFIHRCIHPWWGRQNGLAQGDIGAVLYRYVHSHHHKSYAPTALTGISMLPFEASLYLFAAFIPLFFRCGCHPFLYLYTKLDLVIGAQFGHVGYDAPSTGSYYHELHHAHFECNYGDSLVPLDWLFGTFEDGTNYATDPAKIEDSEAAKANVGFGDTHKVATEAKTQVGDDKAVPLLAAESDTPQRPITMEEVAQHRSKTDCWIVLHGIVLDLTNFLNNHPGGTQVVLDQAGSDATKMFEKIHARRGGFQLVKLYAPKSPIGYVPGWVQEVVESNSSEFLYDAGAQVIISSILAVSCWGVWGVLMGS